MHGGQHFQPPPRSNEEAKAEANLLRDSVRRDMGGGTVLGEIRHIARMIASLPSKIKRALGRSRNERPEE